MTGERCCGGSGEEVSRLKRLAWGVRSLPGWGWFKWGLILAVVHFSTTGALVTCVYGWEGCSDSLWKTTSWLKPLARSTLFWAALTAGGGTLVLLGSAAIELGRRLMGNLRGVPR